ncbi:hypothetical protein G9A89_011036 [Geosiphon pyriformis]|nr:hypothetical protein G9A89_011036 [Geosiphon pyriformis]
MAKRPDYGQLGRKTEIYANHFEIQKVATNSIFHQSNFEVNLIKSNSDGDERVLVQKKIPQLKKHKIFRQLENDYSENWFKDTATTFDGYNTIYSTKPLGLQGENATITVLVEDEKFQVKVTQLKSTCNFQQLSDYNKKKIIEFDWLNMVGVKCLNALIHHDPALNFKQVGESIFSYKNGQNLGNGVEMYMGYHAAVHPGEAQTETINSVIHQLKIKTTHRSASYHIKELSRENAHKALIPTKNISIATYFQDKYKIKLTCPHLVDLQTGNNIQLPIEVCLIEEGQTYPPKGKELSKNQRAQMVKFSALGPLKNKQLIQEGVKNLLRFTTDKRLLEFGTNIDQNFALVPARVLNAPTISYHSRSRICQIWGELEKLTSRDQGMEISDNIPWIDFAPFLINDNDIMNAIQRHHQQAEKQSNGDHQLILLILPDTQEKLYRIVKFTTEINLGILSQCVQAERVAISNKQYCANVAMKLNSKLGGINVQLNSTEIPLLEKEPVLLLGADVTHWPRKRSGEKVPPSIVAVVGSLDRQGGQYTAKLHAQEPETEHINNMKDLVLEILKVYKQKNELVPRRILMFRDGVSDSQFDRVLREELRGIEGLRRPSKWMETTYNVHRCHQAPSHKIIRKE